MNVCVCVRNMEGEIRLVDASVALYALSLSLSF